MTLFKDEKVVMERSYDSILPTLLMIAGGLIMALGTLLGLSMMIELEDPGLLIMSLIFGGLLVWLGKYLKEWSTFRIVITTKRVVQDGPFHRFVSLPLNHIASLHVNRNQLQIGAVGGGIVVGIPDSQTVCDAIAGLLNQLQTEVEVQQAAPAPAPAPVPAYTNHPSAPTPAHSPAKKPSAPTPAPADGWKCSCGRVNPRYMSTCSCGKSAREVREEAKPASVRTAERETAAVLAGVCPDCNCKLEESTIEGVRSCPECGRMFG